MLVDTRPSRWAEALEDVADSVKVVCSGHTHMPFIRLMDRRWLVNSGSTGMPYGSTGVPWALLESRGIQLRSTPIDPNQVAAAIVDSSDFPDVQAWVQAYVLEPPSDLDALLAFAGRDGRADNWNQ